MSNVERMQPWIDACRVQGDELNQPEMRELAEALTNDAEIREAFEESQHWDLLFSQALQEQPVPDDLRAKLLEKYVVPPAAEWSFRRRWWGLALAVAACLMAAVSWKLWSGGDRLDVQTAAQQATAWVQELRLDDSALWNDPAPPDGYEIDSAVQMPPNYRWRVFPVWGDEQAVAFADKRGDMLLVVARTRQIANAPEGPVNEPQSTTGAFCVGVWTRGDLTYVLMVKGGPTDFRQSLLTPPVA